LGGGGSGLFSWFGRGVADGLDDGGVHGVYSVGIEGAEVDVCGALGVVAHALADDVDGYVERPCYAGPRVAGYVHGEWLLYAGFLSDGLQHDVDQPLAFAVLPSLAAVAALDDGQQVVGIVRGVPVDDVLHLLFPAYGELLSGLSPPVGQYAVAQVAGFEVCHVDEGHASGVE